MVIKNSPAQVSPVGVVLVIVIIVLIGVACWYLFQPPSCPVEDQIQLSGRLMGFEKNNTYWNVKISNRTYLFYSFDSDYMKSLLGLNITLTCCTGINSAVGEYYNMVSAYIMENKS